MLEEGRGGENEGILFFTGRLGEEGATFIRRWLTHQVGEGEKTKEPIYPALKRRSGVIAWNLCRGQRKGKKKRRNSSLLKGREGKKKV